MLISFALLVIFSIATNSILLIQFLWVRSDNRSLQKRLEKMELALRVVPETHTAQCRADQKWGYKFCTCHVSMIKEAVGE